MGWTGSRLCVDSRLHSGRWDNDWTGSLTGNSFLVADTLVETAPELLAPVPGDVVVTDVVQRDVAHCKAQRTALTWGKQAGRGWSALWWESAGFSCGFVTSVIRPTNLALKLG